MQMQTTLLEHIINGETNKAKAILAADSQIAAYADDLISGWCILHEAKRLDENNFAALYQHAEHAENFKIGLNILHKAGALKDLKTFPQVKLNIFFQNAKDNDLLRALLTLQQAGLLNPNNINNLFLPRNIPYINHFACGLHYLNKAGILNQENFILFCGHVHNEHFLTEFSRLNQLKIVKDNFKSLCKYADNLIKGVVVLDLHDILNKDNIDLLYQYPQDALELAHTLVEVGNVHIEFHRNLHNDPSLGGALIFFKQALLEKEVYLDLARLPTSKAIYQYIMSSENLEQYNKYSKIAAFFIAHHKTLKDICSSQKKLEEINQTLSQIQPLDLRNHLKNILHKLGGYSFLPDEEKNITLGVEIEYSNIPVKFKQLTEFVMSIIQKDWTHPGDPSVIRIGKHTYQGETTTPILSKNEELISAMINIAFLQTIGAETNASCGLHVHVGVINMEIPEIYEKEKANYQLEFTKQFLIIYRREADKFTSTERELNEYTCHVDLPHDMQKIDTFTQLINLVNPFKRCFEINFHAFLKHGTIEVRRFSGTTEEPQIYAIVSMVAAMAREAQKRTNHIFNEKKNASANDAPMVLFKNMKETEQLPPALLSFFSQTQTERQTELFMLRVNPLLESKLEITTAQYKDEKDMKKQQKNIIYAYLKQENRIEYIFFDREGHKKIGTIENDKRFENIIQKLKRQEKLNSQEENQILCEASIQARALISHRVKKLKSAQLSTSLETKLMKDRFHDDLLKFLHKKNPSGETRECAIALLGELLTTTPHEIDPTLLNKKDEFFKGELGEIVARHRATFDLLINQDTTKQYRF